MILWVFVPIIYVTCVIQLFRLYYNLYSSYTKTKKKVKRANYGDTKDKQLVEKCDHLSKKYFLLTREAFDSRRNYLCVAERGYLVTNGDRPPVDSVNSMQSAQAGMMDNMKGMIVMMATTIPAMAWINSFFAGFVLAKVPFSMTQQFRSLTQSGIDMANLDVSYVSSVSFYFLIVFGLNQLQSLLFDDEADEDSMKVINEDRKQMQAGMNPMAQSGGLMGAASGSQERRQIFKAQIDGLELINHNFVFGKSNREALSRLNDFLHE